MRALFYGQLFHFCSLVVLLPVTWALALDPGGNPWFIAAIGVAIVHQIFVWFGWRMQLGTKLFTRRWGDRDFFVFKAIFFPLLIARPVLILVLGLTDAGSLRMDTGVSIALGLALLIPALYTGWSIQRYFGYDRAAGGDHFRRELRKMPLVKEGAFRWTPNAMYVFAFLGLWSIALLTRSHLALVAALFQHAYIWVHYYATEEPDMRLLHGSRGAVT